MNLFLLMWLEFGSYNGVQTTGNFQIKKQGEGVDSLRM